MAEKDKGPERATTPTARKAGDEQAASQGQDSEPAREGDRYGAPGIPGAPDDNKGGNLAEAQERGLQVRTEVPDAPEQFTVDARLDNRSGTDRPPLLQYPAVPQQVDGPDVMHQVEFTRNFLESGQNVDTGPRLGMFSVGPHGLTADESARSGDDPAGESGGEAAPDGESGATTATLGAAQRAAATRGR
jgi:hypothetical protein